VVQERGDSRQLSEIPTKELNHAMLAEARRENEARQRRAAWEAISDVQVRLAPDGPSHPGCSNQPLHLVSHRICVS
jgi:hypothetical protein